jgi:hypothetical protein
MKKPNISPGEWRADKDSLEGMAHEAAMREFLPDYKAGDYWVIHAWSDNAGSYVAETGCHEFSAANARLIAAAPALYEALEAMLAANAAKLPEYRLNSDITDKARAALALANGEKQ